MNFSMQADSYPFPRASFRSAFAFAFAFAVASLACGLLAVAHRQYVASGASQRSAARRLVCDNLARDSRLATREDDIPCTQALFTSSVSARPSNRR